MYPVALVVAPFYVAFSVFFSLVVIDQDKFSHEWLGRRKNKTLSAFALLFVLSILWPVLLPIGVLNTYTMKAFKGELFSQKTKTGRDPNKSLMEEIAEYKVKNDNSPKSR